MCSANELIKGYYHHPRWGALIKLALCLGACMCKPDTTICCCRLCVRWLTTLSHHKVPTLSLDSIMKNADYCKICVPVLCIRLSCEFSVLSHSYTYRGAWAKVEPSALFYCLNATSRPLTDSKKTLTGPFQALAYETTFFLCSFFSKFPWISQYINIVKKYVKFQLQLKILNLSSIVQVGKIIL